MKKPKLPETNVKGFSRTLVFKLAISVIAAIIPAVISNFEAIRAPLWIITILEMGTILLLIAYVISPKLSEKVVFGTTIISSIFLILTTRVVFPPEFTSPILKYASQILCVAAICCLVELNRYIDSYNRFRWLGLAIIILLGASSILETVSFKHYENAEIGANCITGLWMVFLTVICVLITYKAYIKKRTSQAVEAAE